MSLAIVGILCCALVKCRLVGFTHLQAHYDEAIQVSSRCFPAPLGNLYLGLAITGAALMTSIETDIIYLFVLYRPYLLALINS